VFSARGIDKITVGKLIGGGGQNSGSITAATDVAVTSGAKNVTVLQGMKGGAGQSSGSIISGGTIGKVTVGSAQGIADVMGGTGNFSGAIIAQGGIGTSITSGVLIYGSVTGADGNQSGAIQSQGALTLVDIRGSLTGGTGDGSGSIQANDRFDFDSNPVAAGDLGVVKITGNVTGAGGIGSGSIQAAGDLRSLFAASLQGGAGVDSGSIATGTGVLHFGNTGSITFSGPVTNTITVGGQLKALTVNGGLNGAGIHVGQDLIKAIVTGDVNDSTITAFGAANPKAKTGDIAIDSLTINGNISNSQILAGYDTSGVAGNADASINSVRVTGNWTASNLVAGVYDKNGDGFGNADDARIVGGIDRDGFISTIAKVQVLGTITGSAAPGDHFGFVAEKITSFKVGATTLPLTAATGEVIDIPSTNVTVREVTA
jgi:hypothetical protein